jgi:superfamily I DNA/RNA helicase
MSVLSGWPLYEAAGAWHHNTGKTTSLNTLLDAHLQAGHDPDRILVNAFTRNATQELRRRLGLDMPWVRTIHSSCFRLLQLRSQQVLGPHALREFGEASGFELRGVLGTRSLDDPFGGVSVATLGDWCYVAEELRRQRRQSLEEMVKTLRPPGLAQGWDLELATEFSQLYRDFKHQSRLYDFADMLELVLESRMRPPVTQLFVDEAQDNTALVWAVIDLWREQAERLWTFGDQDQAIFSWQGADPAALGRRPGHQLVLSHSYRLNRAVHAQARQIIRRVRDRVQSDFEPDREGGSVERAWDWVDIALDRPGSWFLLVRNRVFLEQLRQVLTNRGIGFRDRTSPGAGAPALDSDVGRAVDAVQRLARGEILPKMRLRHVRRMVGEGAWPQDGIDAPGALVDLPRMGAGAELARTLQERPLEALKLPPAQHRYLEAILRQDGALRAPRLTLSTVHGVKGEESDHVAVSTAMTNRTYEGYQDDPDDETRVAYVACTRARESLTWILSGGKGFIV